MNALPYDPNSGMHGRLEIEIGFGKSALLLSLAKLNPSTLYIGIDLEPSWCSRAEINKRKRELENVIIVNDEAKQHIKTSVPSNSVDTYHVYFPSPGPPEIRFFYTPTIGDIYRTLCPGGNLRIITDSDDYFDDILDISDAFSFTHLPWTSLGLDLERGQYVGTNCERLYGSKNVLHLRK